MSQNMWTTILNQMIQNGHFAVYSDILSAKRKVPVEVKQNRRINSNSYSRHNQTIRSQFCEDMTLKGKRERERRRKEEKETLIDWLSGWCDVALTSCIDSIWIQPRAKETQGSVCVSLSNILLFFPHCHVLQDTTRKLVFIR